MKQQKRLCSLSYERRLKRYHEEKQQLLKKNSMTSPEEMDRAIKKLTNKWRI